MVGRLIREARQTNKLGHRKKKECKFWLQRVSIVPLKQPKKDETQNHGGGETVLSRLTGEAHVK